MYCLTLEFNSLCHEIQIQRFYPLSYRSVEFLLSCRCVILLLLLFSRSTALTEASICAAVALEALMSFLFHSSLTAPISYIFLS